MSKQNNRTIWWKILYFVKRLSYSQEKSEMMAESKVLRALLIVFPTSIASSLLLLSLSDSDIAGAFAALLFLFIPFASLILIILDEKRIDRAIKNKRALEVEALSAERMRQEQNKRLAEQQDLDRELKRVAARRDSENQEEPFTYKIGRHANETLALRYGIPNVRRNGSEENHITVRKLRRAGMISDSGAEQSEPNCYLVELTKFRRRKALAIIEPGTDYVKTFLPLHHSWFSKNMILETALKGNPTMTLKEIVGFYIMKANIDFSGDDLDRANNE